MVGKALDWLKAAISEGFNYCWSCGKKIPKGAIICDDCNKGDD